MFLLLVAAIIVSKMSSFCSVLISLLLRDSLSVKELLYLFANLRVSSKLGIKALLQDAYLF